MSASAGTNDSPDATSNGRSGTAGSASAVARARRLLKQGNLVRARATLDFTGDSKAVEVARLRALADVASTEDKHVEAAELLGRAHALSPQKIDIALDYVDRLTDVGTTAVAYSVLHGLPEDAKESQHALRGLYWIYRLNSWYAHASRLQAKHSLVRLGWRRRIMDLVLLPARPVLLRIERGLIADFEYQTGRLSPMQTLGIRDPARRYRAYREAEIAILSMARTSAAIHLTEKIGLRALWLLAFVIVVGYFATSASGGEVALHLIVGPILVAVCFALGGSLWRRSRSGLTGLMSVILFALAAGGLGALLLRLPPVPIVSVIGLGLNAGALFTATAVLVVFAISISTAHARRRAAERNARGTIILHLADLVLGLDEARTPGGSIWGAYYTLRLEEIAILLERGVIQQVRTYDQRTDEWMRDRLHGAAEALRHTKRMALSPDGASDARMSRLLRHQLLAVATDNWMNAAYREPSPQSVRTWRDRLTSSLRVVAVAALPGLALVAISPWTDFGTDVGSWARIAALGWGVLTVIWAIDPAVRDKVDVARGIATSIREFGGKASAGEPGGDPQKKP